MFKPVNPKEDFPAMERRILEWWYEKGIVKKYLHKNDHSKKRFSFLDGPITANNPMGVHHGWGRTYKDLWQRFYHMKGFKERFQNGFDNQGLWVEVEVEKKLGFKTKKDIEKYGIARFVEDCKRYTLDFAKVQTTQSKRLGYFMDWDNSYYTLSDQNNYTIWYFLKKCFLDGNLYKGRDAVPWCPRCGTAISQHEILTEDYKEATHDSIYIEYPLKGRTNEFLLVWTTTPWTLPGNVAVAVSGDKDYVMATGNVAGNKYYLLASAAKRLGLKIVKKLKGGELSGWSYESPFDHLSRVKESLKDRDHRVVITDEKILPVSEEEGTGMVHVASGAGTEDFRLGKKLGLPVIELINEEAIYLDGLGEFSGQNAKDHPELILDFIKEKEGGKYLFDIVPYTHRYPICWRCKTELVWRVVDEWYIAMDDQFHPGARDYRKKMIEVAKKISWLPKWGLERELDWLKNMQDWLISKKRYWGLALPIWECQKCGRFTVIGGKQELKEKAVLGYEDFQGHSPHRPWIDKVKIRCSCGEVISRIPDVGNPWLDAGIVSFSTLGYLEDRNHWRKWFPADFVTECFPGQFKNWFYSLLAMSTILENTLPFKTLLGHALVRDEKGEEMHKSKGNAIWFDEAVEKMGADVMRWMYVTQNPEINLNFGYHVADETRRRFHLMLWNVYNFFVTYANVDKFKVQKSKIKSQNVLDKWIISRLNQLIKGVTESLDNYDAFTASHKIEDFVDDLSTWYVRRSRERVGPAAPAGEDKENCYATLYEVLVSLSKLLAPFNPFLAEEMYQNLKFADQGYKSDKSVHLESWPKMQPMYVDDSLEKEMGLVRRICELGHAARKKEGIKVRQPLRGIRCTLKYKELGETLIQLIKEELNVKSVDWVSGANEEPEIELDTHLTPLLKAEGEARELVHEIQRLRKEEGCLLDERIDVITPSWPKEFEEYIKRETLARNLRQGGKIEIRRFQ